jgi:hypothetical protein
MDTVAPQVSILNAGIKNNIASMEVAVTERQNMPAGCTDCQPQVETGIVSIELIDSVSKNVAISYPSGAPDGSGNATQFVDSTVFRLQSLDRIKESIGVVYVSDKAGNISLDTFQFFLNSFTISGTVTPIAEDKSVTIELMQDNAVVRQTNTDSNGDYKLDDIALGTYSIIFKSDCYDIDNTDSLITITSDTLINRTASIGTTIEVEDQIVCLGSTATIVASVNGNTDVTYQWQKNGESLTSDEVISGVNTHTLRFTSIRASDIGKYSLLITNTCGATAEAELLIDSIPSTKITSGLRDSTISINPGAFVVLKVEGTGENIEYEWQKDGVTILGVTENLYTILNADASDKGEYRVIVRGTCGADTSATVINIDVVSVFEGTEAFTNLQVIPNPITSTAKVMYSLARTTNIQVRLSDVLGNNIIIHEGMHQNGEYSQIIDPQRLHLSSGLYNIELIDIDSGKLLGVTQCIVNE